MTELERLIVQGSLRGLVPPPFELLIKDYFRNASFASLSMSCIVDCSYSRQVSQTPWPTFTDGIVSDILLVFFAEVVQLRAGNLQSSPQSLLGPSNLVGCVCRANVVELPTVQQPLHPVAELPRGHCRRVQPLGSFARKKGDVESFE